MDYGMNVFDFLFESTRDLTKDFVLGPRQQISYKNLFEKSSILARRLKAEVGTIKPIIILSENSIFFITAYLAILKSGNVCVPLNPNIEKVNFENILQRTSSKQVFVSKRYQKNYEDYNMQVFGEDYLENLPEEKNTS